MLLPKRVKVSFIFKLNHAKTCLFKIKVTKMVNKYYLKKKFPKFLSCAPNVQKNLIIDHFILTTEDMQISHYI